MNIESFIPQPIRDFYEGGKQIQAGKANNRSTQITFGATKCAKGALHLLLGGAFMGLSTLADRYLPFGNVALNLVGGALSLPATCIGNGLKVIYYGAKALPSAIAARSARGIGISTLYLGTGYLLLTIPSHWRAQELGLLEANWVRPTADRIGNKARAWL